MSPSGASVNVWTFLIVVFESLNCSQCEKMNLKIQFKWKGFKYAKDAGFCRTRMIFLKNSAQFNGSLLCVCTLDGLNAENRVWVWVTILGPIYVTSFSQILQHCMCVCVYIYIYIYIVFYFKSMNYFIFVLPPILHWMFDFGLAMDSVTEVQRNRWCINMCLCWALKVLKPFSHGLKPMVMVL